MKSFIFFLVYFLFFILEDKVSNAQVDSKLVIPYFESFQNKDGLSQGFISSIIQDKDGFLWFATKDGLNKYDGYKVKVYRQDPENKYSIQDNGINAIAEDEFGQIWVGTASKGLFMLDKQTDKFYPIQLDQDKPRTINSIQIKNKKMLVQTEEEVRMFDISQVKLQQHITSSMFKLSNEFSLNNESRNHQVLSDKMIQWHQLLPNHSIWFSKADTMVAMVLNPRSKKWDATILRSDVYGMEANKVHIFFSIGQGDSIVSIGTDAISIFDTKRMKLLYKKMFGKTKIEKQIFYYNNPRWINDNTIYFADMAGGHHFNPRTLQYKLYGSSKSEGALSGPSTILDKDGILWVGTGGRGIYKYNTRRELFGSEKEDCYGFYEDDDGKMYINFRTGPCIYDLETKQRSPIIPSKLMNPDWTRFDIVCSDKYGTIWIRCLSIKANKLILLRYNTFMQSITVHSDLLSDECKTDPEKLISIFTDKSNNIWQLYFANDQQCRFKVTDAITFQSKTEYTLPSELGYKNFSSFLSNHVEDDKGNFWFGTNKGLYRFTPTTQQWKRFNSSTDTNSLSGNIIFSLLPDMQEPNKYIWVGTNGNGLNKFELETGRCKHFTTKNGLPNDVIYGMLNDEFGNLWLSTNQGLSCFNVKSETFRNYTVEDGLPGNEYNRHQYFKAKNGTLFFGGVDGITWFKPSQILSNLLPESPIKFTGFSIYNKEINSLVDSTILKQTIQYTKEIILPADKNMFSIEFALLQFCQADKKHYLYYLEGFDKSWIDNGTKNSAIFTNLDAGTYTLHVKGCNSDGVWNKEGISINLIVKAFWYNTWWFRGFILILIAGAIYAFYKYRLTQSLRMANMRNIIASDLHDEIGSTISSITVYSDIIEDRIIDDELKHIASRISSSSRNILIAMSDIVWSINPVNDRFDNVILRMKSFANEILELQHKQLVFEVDEKLNSINLQMNRRKNFYLIFKEALNNVVKYANASLVRIEMKLESSTIYFVIIDNGKGFNLSDYKEGNGLLNMKQRAKDLDGELHIYTQPGEGTKIELRFPADK